MNTTYRSIPLQSGQAFPVDRHRPGRLFLAEGDVLLETPAAWLGGRVVLSPARRVTAPAELDVAQISSIHALGPAKVLVERAASPLAKLRSAWEGTRFAWARRVAKAS